MNSAGDGLKNENSGYYKWREKTRGWR